MANQQLLEYMKAQMKNGFKKDDLIAAVRKAGWQESAIQEVVREMEPPPARVIPPQAVPALQKPVIAEQPIVSAPVVQQPKPVQAAPSQPAPISAQPVRPLPQKPIAIDASGNLSVASPAFSRAATTFPQAEVSASSFGIPQQPQMRPAAHPFQAQPAFPPARPQIPTFAPIEEPKPVAPLPIRPAVPMSAPQIPLAPAIQEPIITPRPSINLIQDAPRVIPADPVPVMAPIQQASAPAIPPMTIRPMTAAPALPIAQAPAASEPLPSFMPKPVPQQPIRIAMPAPIKLNPAFIPGTRPQAMTAPAPAPAPVLQPKPAFAAEKMPIAAVAAASASAAPGISSAGAFQGMRPGTGIMPQGRPAMVSRPPIVLGTGAGISGPVNAAPPSLQQRLQQANAPKKKGRKGLLIFIILILLLLLAGGFVYLEYPSSIQQAQNSVSALLPGAAPSPNAVLGNAITKLFNTTQLKFDAKIGGATTSVDPSTAVSVQGDLSGSIASVLPFPASSDVAKFSLSQGTSTLPALNATANILTSASQGLYFQITDISGPESAAGGYDQLKNIWISIDPATIGFDKISAIFGSDAFISHEDQIKSILLGSQILAVAAVYNDDPGSGLYHYGVAIQKQNILPAILQIAQVLGTTLSPSDEANISDSINAATLPGFEAWINKDSLTLSRIKITATKKGTQTQSVGADITLLPLIGNPPAINVPDNAITLDQALNPAPAATTAKK